MFYKKNNLRRQNNFIYLHSENECIMELFKGQSLLEFTERFKTDLDCEEYLASLKWEDGYCCRKCGHTKYQVRKDFSRTCNICGDIVERSPVSQSQLVCS